MIDGALCAHVPAIDPFDDRMLLVATLDRLAPPLLALLPDLLVLRLEHRVRCDCDLLPAALALHSVLSVARVIETGTLNHGLTRVHQR